MINIDKLPVIVDQQKIQNQNKKINNLEDTLKRYKQGLKGIEEFMTYIYHNSRKFRDLKESFNEKNDYCRIRLKDNKIKVEVYEDN